MKAKYLFICAAVALLASCQEKPDNGGDKTNYQEMTFTAEIPTIAGVATGWKAGDAITIFDGKANQKFVASADGQKVSFVGTANADAKEYSAVTPYDKALSRKSGKVALNVASKQDVVAGAFNPAYNYAVAYTTGTDLKFKNLLAAVKLEVSTPGYKVVAATIEAVGGEPLSGAINVALAADPTCEAGAEASSKVNLSGNFDGVCYALVVPSALSQGLKIALTDEADSRAEVVIPSVNLKAGEVADLGVVAPTDWKEATNPNPTQVAGAVILKASFKTADFNLVNDGGFEEMNNNTWIPTWNTTISTATGYNSPTALRIERPADDGSCMTNFEQGCKWQMGNEDTRWIMEFDARVDKNCTDFYSGFGFFDAFGNWWKEVNSWGDPTENGRIFWRDEAWHHYILDDTCFRGQYKGEVHVGMWGVPSWAEYDNLIAYPFGYDIKGTSTEPEAYAAVLGRVTNATFDDVDALGKVVAWVDTDSKVKLAFSNVTINGTLYPSAIAEADADASKIEITKFYKNAGLPSEIVPLGAGQISFVPDDVFAMNGKTYMHYYTTIEEAPENFNWTADASGFAVSEDGGKTWAPATKFWAGSKWAKNNDGKFSTATFANHDGFTYMIGSYAGRDNWLWGQTYGARVADGADLTDPDAYEYWTNNPPAGAWRTGGEACIDETAPVMQGDRGVNDMIWNPKFGVYQIFYRADRVNGILYRDSKGPDAEGNWYWSGAKLLCKDEDTGVLGSVSVLKVEDDGSVILVGSQL